MIKIKNILVCCTQKGLEKIPLNIEYDVNLTPKRYFLIYDLNPLAAGFATYPVSTKAAKKDKLKNWMT